MTIATNQLLQSSFVISIDEARHQQFNSHFHRYGLDNPLPSLYEGFKINNGIHKEQGMIKTSNICNCFFTHIALVKMAQCLGMDYICIFEDDALPRKDIQEKLQCYLSNLPDDIDMLKFGWLTTKNIKKTCDRRFIKADTLGSHAYVVFKQFYKKYLDEAYACLAVDKSSMNSPSANILTTNELLFIQANMHLKIGTLHNNSKFFNKLDKDNITKDFEL